MFAEMAAVDMIGVLLLDCSGKKPFPGVHCNRHLGGITLVGFSSFTTGSVDAYGSSGRLLGQKNGLL